MNTVPIVPENVASRMPAQPASAPMSAHKPSVTEQVAVRGLTYTVRGGGGKDVGEVIIMDGKGEVGNLPLG